MRSTLFNLVTTLFSFFLFSQAGVATVFYEDDFENGVQYIGSANRHPGGGHIVFLGGEIVNGYNPGNGTQNFQQYTNVVLDSSAEARNAISGSSTSLKTQYKAGYEHEFGLNTTIISFPETDDVYIRWYQKWSKDWIWPGDQQKLTKVKGPGSSQNFKISWSKNFINLTKRSPAPYEQLNETYVFSDLASMGDSPTPFLQPDSDSTNGNYPLERDRWYCIEIMVLSNTPGQQDAQFAYWIDDVLRFNLVGADNRGSSNRGINLVEMQHVLQTGGANNTIDTPTWMDNIVIADERIGCDSSFVAEQSSPMSPSEFSASVLR